MNKLLTGIIMVLFAFSLVRCDEQERTIMTTEERQIVDSLYSKDVPELRAKTDSICDAQYQLIFNKAADSIKLLYIQEIKNIIEGEG